MAEWPIIAGVIAWVAVALVSWLFLRRLIYNPFDPMMAGNIGIPFSAALLTTLCATELVSWDKLGLFALLWLCYLAGGRCAGGFFSISDFRTALENAVGSLRRGEIYVVLTIALAVTGVVAVMAIQQGAAGDNRLAFNKAFRPLVLLQEGFSWISLVVLLSPRLRGVTAGTWVTLLLLFSMPFSGKGALLPAMFWFGLRTYVNRTPLTMRTMLSVIGLVLGGAIVMILLAYNTSGLVGSLAKLMSRFTLFGDVYIYAYQRGGLDDVRGTYPVSFGLYMLHPIISLVGIRAYDKPLGAMIASAVVHEDVVTGPNPQIPVLLDFFFPGQLLASGVVAFLIGVAVLAIRTGSLALTRCRSRYLVIGALTAAFVCPSSGFIDTSQVLISLVSIAAATLVLVMMELILSRSPSANTPLPALTE